MESDKQKIYQECIPAEQEQNADMQTKGSEDKSRNQECLHSQQEPNPDMKANELEDKLRIQECLHSQQELNPDMQAKELEDKSRDQGCILAEQEQTPDMLTKGSKDKSRNQECLHSQQEPNPDMKAKELEDKSRETRRLHIENQYLKLILDRIYRIINVGEARSNIELKPPEDLEDDQSVKELTTNLGNVELKLYDLEWELDYIHVKISELANMIVGGEGSDVTQTPEKVNQCKALGLKPRSNPAEAHKQSERSLKLDKDLERVTSSWRDMKEKNTEEIKRLHNCIDNLESLVKNLYDRVVPTAEGSDQPPESSLPNTSQYIQYIYKRILKMESSNEEYAETNFCLEEILAALDSYCSSKIETKDNRLGKGNQFASRCSIEYERAEHIADRFKEMKKEKSILEERNRTMQYSISCLQQEKVDMDGKYQRMIEKQNQEMTRLRHAEESLLTRLSKIAGDRFTHDNVNIADLSDADRPTKLSETYSELYDNEWTDAFEELTENMKLPDEAAIRLLLKILMNAFRKCKEVTWDRYDSLKLVASCLDVKQEQLPSMIAEEEQPQGTDNSNGKITIQHDKQTNVVGTTASSPITSESQDTDRSDGKTTGQYGVQNEGEGTASSDPTTLEPPGTDQTDRTNVQHVDQTKEVKTTASEHPDEDKSDGTVTGQLEDQQQGAGTTSSRPTTLEHSDEDKSDGTVTGQLEDQHQGAGTTSSSSTTLEHPDEDKSDGTVTGQLEDQHQGPGTTSSSPTTLESPDKSDGTTKVQHEDQNKGVGTSASNPTTLEHPDKSDGTTKVQHEDQNKGTGTTASNPTTSEPSDANINDGMTTGRHEDQHEGAGTTSSNPSTSERLDKSDGTTKVQQEDQNKGEATFASNPTTSEPPDANINDGMTTGQHEDQNEGAGTTSSSPTTSEICMQSASLTSTLSIDQEKSLKNIWRATTIDLKDKSLKLLCANLLTCLGKPETEMPKTSKYLRCCTELCWKMGVQEKPMHLDVNAEKQVGEEKQFDTDRFRAYTKTGKSVAYVVWPALFLHEDGAMLAKGIAQGCQKRVSSKE